MKRACMLLLAFLIVSLVLTSVVTTEVKAQESNGSFGCPTVPDIAFVNWTHFWSLFNAHSDWDLEYDDGFGWISIKSDLQILKNYTVKTPEGVISVNKSEAIRCKITLNFTASYNADYRLTFGIDLDVKNYTHKTDSWNYTIAYKNYTVVFDWSDIKDLPLDYVGHGVKPIGDESWFWFRIRKDDVPIGKNVIIDPSFGHEDEETSDLTINDKIYGGKYSCSEAGTADSITVLLDDVIATTKIKCMLYKDSDDTLVGTTEERVPGAISTPTWETFNFEAPKPSLTAQDYWIVAWADDAAYVKYDSGTATIGFDVETYNDPPNPWEPTEYANYDLSIFCNYTTGGAQEYTEEFSETINPSTSLYLWKALFEKYEETVTLSATSYGWKEKASFHTETTTITEQMLEWIELKRFFTETIIVTETASFTMEIMMEFIEFTETITIETFPFLWKAKQFITQETVGLVANFYDWIELKMTMVEFIDTIEINAIMDLTIVIPVTIEGVYALAAIAFIIAVSAFVYATTKKD